jgi:hypothetical protein
MKSTFRLSVVTAAALWFAGGVAEPQPVISTNFVLPSSQADTSKPGFVWNFHQIRAWLPSGQAPRPATLQRAQNQLAGLLGNNDADPNASGIASGPAAQPSPLTAPITFLIPGVINLDRGPSERSSGNFQPDLQMPGSPGLLPSMIGTDPNTDYQAAEALTWLDLPAGTITMGCNSDDGFRVTIGGATPNDPSAVIVGQFDAPRGAANNFFQFTVQKAGLYAARMLYVQGISNGRIEWFTATEVSTGVYTNLVLINDAVKGGIRAYQDVTGAKWAYVRKAVPLPDVSLALPNTPVTIELLDGGTTIDPTTVKLSLDGTQVAVGTKSGNVTTASYTPSGPFVTASQHTVTLTYTEGTKPVSMTWAFTVMPYATLPASAKVTPDAAKAGFLWNIFANDADTTVSIAKAENALAGLLVDADGNPRPNLADPNAQGVAVAKATAPSPANAPVKFEVAGAVNVSVDGLSYGGFSGDGQMPGVPTSSDGVAAEILTFIQLPAGLTVMGVNQNDGFSMTAGAQGDVFNGLTISGFDGAGLSEDGDHLFCVAADAAGVYPFRVVWVQGTGPGSLEWFSLKPDGTKVLVNDRAKGGLTAYRATTTVVPPQIKSVSPDPVPRQLNLTSSSLVVVLADGTNPVDTNSIVLKLDAQVLAPSVVRSGSTVTLTYVPALFQAPSDGHTAEVTFNDTTGGYPRTQAWRFYNLKSVLLPASPVMMEDFNSYDEGTVPTGWVETNFTSTVTAGFDLGDLKSDAYKGWVVVTLDRIRALKASLVNCAPGQVVNGNPITFDDLCDGSLIYAESDSRSGNQVQFLVTKPYDLSQVKNPIVSFSSLYSQNQDNMDGLEYSVDGGLHWLPVVYYVDTKDSGGADLWLNLDGTVDAVKTFTDFNYDAATWVEGGVTKGFNYGDGLKAPITQALGPFIAPRWNDNQQIDKRWEIYRLPAASKKADVRLRFIQLGTGSWYWGVDKLAIYDLPSAAATPKLTIAASAGNITISWTGSGSLLEATTAAGPWTISASQLTPQTVLAGAAAKFYCIGAP